MNATREDTTGTWTVRVAVRVPRDDGDDLLESARRRLEASRSVDDVEIGELCGLEPAFSATLVRAEVRVAVAASVDEATVEERLVNAPGVQRVERLRRA